MRKMRNKKTGKSVTIIEYIMMKHSCYEYYVLDKKYEDADTIEILAYGDEIEQATVFLSRLRPDIAFRTKKLNSLIPIPGWKWVRPRKTRSC